MSEEHVQDLGIVLEDEEGNEHRFEIYGSIDVDGQLYAILMPEGALDETDEGDEIEVVIARVDGEEDTDSVAFAIVDDDAEFQAVLDAWELAEDDEDDMDGEE